MPQQQQENEQDTITKNYSVQNREKKRLTHSGKGPEKTWYGWLRGWWRKKPLVLGCIDVIRRNGHLRVYLHVRVHERGKWPWFKQEYLLESFTIQIPTPIIKDITQEITEHYGTRMRKTKAHTWEKRRYAQ